jgi:hypothetical protein
MSKPFTDLNLSDNQIASNYTWKQVKNTQEYIDTKVFDDLEKNLLVVSNQDNTLDQSLPTLTDNVIVGTNIDVANSSSTISMGHHFLVSNSNDIVKIGGAQNIAADDTITNSNQCISIGFDNSLGPANTCISIGFDDDVEGNLNINLGNANDINGNSNILIGSDIFLTHSSMNNNVIISPVQIPNPAPVDGSLIFGGGTNNPPAGDARIQFLSNNLVAPGGTAAFPVNYFATIPIRYRGVNYRIPVLSDP